MRYSESDSGTQALTFVDVLNVSARAAELPSPGWGAITLVERFTAAVMLTVLLPLLAAAGVVIWLLSRRPPLIAHARVGRGGSTMWVLKLRSMWPRNPKWQRGVVERLRKDSVPELKSPHDPRITSRFAALCRKYSIDELPQLWHVLEGKMSLVGPRPMTADELLEHYGPDAAKVLCVKPGLTGLWQVRGRSKLNYHQRRRLDLFLVRKASARLYLAILLATIPRVLSGKDAW